MTQLNPQRLPTTQASSYPYVLPVFSFPNYNASPAIQVSLPASLDAILFLAIAVVYQYFPVVLSHYELLIHVQLSNVESNTLGP